MDYYVLVEAVGLAINSRIFKASRNTDSLIGERLLSKLKYFKYLVISFKHNRSITTLEKQLKELKECRIA